MSTDVGVPESLEEQNVKTGIVYRSVKPLVGSGDSCLSVADLWSMAFDISTSNNESDVDLRPHMASRKSTATRI
jgi:hypothetical protein